MPIDTNLNVSPYFDDFDETKNFHRVLFRPSTAVQARELTQLQTILQNQIERFGDNIYIVGSIIEGCSLTTDYYYYYIKIKDLQVDGQPVVLDNYANTLLVQTSSNLQAFVVNFKVGLESQDPDLSTLYIKYLNTGTAGQKTYSNNQVITVFDRRRTLEAIIVDNGGTLFANSDTVVITSGGGSGATASITTFANGTISEVTITAKGEGYTSNPSITVTTSTGVGATLLPRIFISELTIANNTFTAPVGTGVAIKTSDGIIYQKGNFIRVAQQEEILSKYTTVPSNVAVGFAVNESFVNSSIDTTLLDNSTGSPNFAAPGADRLKLEPRIVVLNRADAAANTDFLSLLEFEDGNIVKDRTLTQFNSINDTISRRTFEESGNYVVNQIPLNTSLIAGNSTHFNLVVGAGLAYVDGNRIELLNNIKIPVRKGTDTANSSLQTINSIYGNFVTINELLGAYDVKSGATVTLRSVAATDVTDNAGGTPTAPGIQIGTAKVRSLEYASGIQGTPTCQYRLYLFDVRLSRGFSFKDVRSIAIPGVAIADVVLQNTNAVIEDVKGDKLVFKSGTSSVKEFNNETFIFRASSNGTFLTTGNIAFSFSGGNTLPFGTGLLSGSLKQQFIIIPTQTITSNTSKTGTVDVANNSTLNVAGTSTVFTSDYQIGDHIKIGSKNPARITNIFNNTLLSLSSNVGTATGDAHTIAYPANVPIDFNKPGKNIEVTSSTGLTLSLGHPTTATGTVIVYHDVQNFEPAVKAKSVSNPVFVKISANALSRSTTGPFCLGIPDVFEISGVFIGTGGSFSNTSTTNFKDQFILDDGQKDNFYGLSFIKKRPGSSLSLSRSSNLLVQLKCFTHGSGKYISTESYPVDDVTNPIDATSNIRTQEIPFFFSPTTGEGVPLSDSIDFRPIVANTAALSSTAGGATVDPSLEEELVAGEKFFPSPTRSFQASIESFLRRTDRILIDSDGDVQVIEGFPSNQPSAPPKVRGAMDLGILRIAPFPSLSSKEAADAKRPDLANDIRLSQTKRYTMKDINSFEDRIRNLEYYVSLSQLESSTKNLTLVSEANNQVERFKNGFLVDPFNNYEISNLDDPEFKSLIDADRSRLSPLKDIFDIPLQYISGGQKTGDLITLPFAQELLIEQLYANRERTLVEENYSFKGQMQVVPNFDNFFDTNITATSAISVDIATPIENLTRAVNAALSRLAISSELIGTETIFGADRDERWNVVDRDVTVNRTFSDTFNSIRAPESISNSQEVGNFLTDFTLNPFIRPQRIAIFVSGLRPGAAHFLFFDGINLSAQCTPAELTVFTNVTPDSFVATGQRGASLVADSNGQLALFLSIPANTFNTGERNILIMDIDNLVSETSATSKSVGRFSSFNFSGDKTRVTFSTRSFDISPQNQFDAQTFDVSRVETETTRQFFWWDPLAQTFRVQPQVDGSDTLFLTSIDLFFKAKDPNVGVAVELREVGPSGFPTELILPFSKTYKRSQDVFVSNNASLATTFTFASPISVSAGREYAIVMTPDANSPEYRIWSGQTGLPDIGNPQKVMNESWGLGTLFHSVSGSAFTPIQNEDIKFIVRYAKFSSLTSNVVVQNANLEFLSVENSVGSFEGGEDVAQFGNSYINATLTTNTASRVVGTSVNLSSTLNVNDFLVLVYDTSRTLRANVAVAGVTVTNTNASAFLTDFSVGDFVKISNSTVQEIRQVVSIANNTQLTIDSSTFASFSDHNISSIVPNFDVIQVKAANSSTITGNKPPSSATSATVACSFQRVVTGKVTLFDGASGRLYLNNSNAANSTFLINSSNNSYRATIVGSDSNAITTVANVTSIGVSSFKSLVNALVLRGTGIGLSGTFSKAAGGTHTQSFNANKGGSFEVNDNILIRSKSNEITGTTVTKSLSLTFSLSSARNDMSPVIDINPSSLVAASFLINNSTANENTRFGEADAKYISKRLVLSDGLDAEDVRVFISAFRPTTTDVHVYAKIHNETDSDILDNKDWSELRLVSPDVFSASLDENDLREYEYTFKLSPSSAILPGVITTSSNSTIVGNGTQFVATFNSNSGITNATDFISIANNLYVDGDDLTYIVDTGNTALVNLTNLLGTEVQAAVLNEAGTGYTNGDIIALTTGIGSQALFEVTTDGGGNASSIAISSRGFYSSNPTLSNSSTQSVSGGGSGATANVTIRTLNGPYFVVSANTSGVKLSLELDGTPIDLTKGVTEGGHSLAIITGQDLVKVVKLDSQLDYEIFPVGIVIDGNTLKVNGNVSHSTSGTTIEKVTLPNEAFKFAQSPVGNNVVRYYDSNLTPYDTYKTLALKVILTSETSHIVPIINDVRAIAVSI